MGDGPVEPLPILTVGLLEVGDDEVVLGGEVAIEAHLGHPGLGNDGVDPHRPEPVPIEQAQRRVQDPSTDGQVLDGGHQD
jgi:hypothetical protein